MTQVEGPVGLGVVGLGRGFTLMLPSIARDPRFRLVAATTPGRRAREAFARDFGGRIYDGVGALCADPDVDAVYVASPHQVHCEHVLQAVAAGRHVLVEKPMAITLEEGERMAAAADATSVHIVVGPSHSFDGPVLKARELIRAGGPGGVRMIHAMNYTDFLYRPRRPEELDTSRGGGVVFSQAIHQIDVVRLLAGGMATSIYARSGNWDPARPTEGAYSALLEFAGGAFASLTYSGYGRFDSDEFMGWMGELGRRKDPEDYGRARGGLLSADAGTGEAELKRARNYGYVETASILDAPPPEGHEHFGVVVASCERADLRLTAEGVMVYADDACYLEPVPAEDVPRAAVMDELYDAVVNGKPPLHSGAWGLASLEAAVALLESARTGRRVELSRQVAALPDQIGE